MAKLSFVVVAVLLNVLVVVYLDFRFLAAPSIFEASLRYFYLSFVLSGALSCGYQSVEFQTHKAEKREDATAKQDCCSVRWISP